MNILAINPPIIDFAAYDFWLKPYGLLVLLTYLKRQGAHIDFIDCLEKRTKLDQFGRGRFYTQTLAKPKTLKHIPRKLKRYGKSPQELKKEIGKSKNADFVFLTSAMTYWYLAVKETANLIKSSKAGVPLALGGNYVSLCFRHAQENIAADFFIPHQKVSEFIKSIGFRYEEKEFFSTLPAYEYFYSRLPYLVLRTSWGCPFNCSFCAIKSLALGHVRIEKDIIVDYLSYYNKKGIKDFVFYDDAFLYPPQKAKELLSAIAKSKIKARFHTPNALHLRFLDSELARLLKTCNFINPHFGLETLVEEEMRLWGNKANMTDLLEAANFMKKAGFLPGEFSVYLLLGYPKQDLAQLKFALEKLNQLGIRVSLAEFSPVPTTNFFQQYPPPFDDPLWHNNSLFPFWPRNKWQKIFELKNYARSLNRKFI